MTEQLIDIQMNNLEKLYGQDVNGLEKRISARREGDEFHFKAFGQSCRLTKNGVYMDDVLDTEWAGVLVSIHALNAGEEDVQLYPLQSFKEIGGTVAHGDNWVAYGEKGLTDHAGAIHGAMDRIIAAFDGFDNKGRDGARGDFSFTLYPFPKVPQFYNFYLADDEFPASVKCLIASNAKAFLPVSTIGDVAYVTAKKMVEMVTT
jgi:hypothetical protein